MDGQPDDFWAKLSPNYPEKKAWHPLAAHSADVAAVTEALLTRTILGNRFATLIGWDKLSDVHIARLSALAGIHDAGKVNHGFQDQAFDLSRRSPGHVKPLVEIINADVSAQEKLLMPLGIEPMLEWFPPDSTLNYFLLATWGHHGSPVRPEANFQSSLWERNSRRDPVAGLAELGRYVRKWFPEAFDSTADPFPADPELQHAFNGVVTLADWIGSDQRFFKFAEHLDDPMPLSRGRAERAIASLFLDPQEARQALGADPVNFRGVLDDVTPYAIQQACVDLPLHQNGSLTILESDTGSGKTEAAVARFMRLYQARLVDGMYFAVPTRSAAKQLHRRITAAAARIFPKDSRPPVVQAVPGYVKADDEVAKRFPGFKVLWDDVDTLPYRGWAAEHPKRYLAGPIVVGTIDQVLLSALQVKHAHMRAGALLRHFLVVDEVHASDVYMTTLMDMVLDQHLSSGGHALLMSATLGASARVKLATNGRQEMPDPPDAEREKYPLLTHVDATRQAPKRVHAASSGKSKEVSTELRGIAGSPDEIAHHAAAQARAGGRVLVIRNLVADCIATQQSLEEIMGSTSEHLFGVQGTAAPHHSRFAPEDRRRLDDAIESTFGRDSPTRGMVAVATQTVEQSLDIDADVLITDLCPLDVLLQRIGRLQRHERKRSGGFEKARCVVLTPAERDLSGAILSDGTGRKGKHGLGTVYDDLRAIEAAWRALEDASLGVWRIPDHNRLLVERATHPKRLRAIADALGPDWKLHQQHILGQAYADRQHPEYVGIDRHKPFGQEPFAKNLGRVQTRLGDERYRVELPDPVAGPFGESVSALTLAAWQINGEPPDEMSATNVEAGDGGFHFLFGNGRYQYNRFGLKAVG